MSLITAEQIKRVAPRALPHVVNAIADRADDLCPRYGLTTTLRIYHFLAQCAEVTGGFRVLEENLFSSAAGLRKEWPSLFRRDAEGQEALKPRHSISAGMPKMR